MQTCETCLHWQPIREFRGVMSGDCTNSDPRLPCTSLDPSTYRPVLVTPANFGCVAYASLDEALTPPGAEQAQEAL